MKVIQSLLLIILLPLATLAQSQPKYKIYHTQSGKEITFNQFIAYFENFDIIIFGEEHNDQMAHQLQLEIYESLYYLNDGKVTLSLEMWEKDVQPVMDEYLNNLISEKNFIKESRAWNNYTDYKPLIEFAKKKHLPVICANTPARYTNIVTRGSFKALDDLPYITKEKYLPPLPIQLLTGRYAEKFKEAMGGHDLPNIYLYESQNLWDATMAHSIITALDHYPFQKILHINGRFHSDEYLGVVYRIKHQKHPVYTVLTISAIQEKTYNHPSHKDLADFVILTAIN